MKSVVIVDSNWVVNKTYHVLKSTVPEYNLSTVDHWYKTVRKCIIDICSILRSLNLQVGRDEVWFCFDRGRSFRKDLYVGYKASRPEKDLFLEPLLLEVEELLSVEFNTFFVEGLESDDLIYQIIATETDSPEITFTIVASDEDLQQLVSNNVCVLKPFKDTKTIFSTSEFFNRMDFSNSDFILKEVDPTLILVKKLLLGCDSDEIPRLLKKGIGPKTVEKQYEKCFQKGHPVELIAENICIENNYIVDLSLILENLLLVDLKLGFPNYSELQRKLLLDRLYHKRHLTKKVSREPDKLILSEVISDSKYVNDLFQL